MFRHTILGGFVALTFATASMGALTHQYTFNDGTADDSVGSADGLFQFSSVQFGQLQLNGLDGYLELPGATIGVNSYANASFEGWFTYVDNGAWERLYDFGTTNPDDANSGADYLFYSPQGGGGTSRMAIQFQDETPDPDTRTEEGVDSGAPMAFGTQHHVVAVYDDANDMMNLYEDGVLAGSSAMTLTLAEVSDVNAWVGRSLYANDDYLQGGINEFNIYNHALTAQEVADNFSAGPDGGSDGPLVTVNRDTGEITLSNSSSDVQVSSYAISSASGALDPTTWVPVTGNKDAGGDGSFDSDDFWNIVVGPPAGDTSTLLSEEEPVGTGGTLGSLSFGPAWRKTINEDVSVTFNVLDTVTFDETVVTPAVEYVGNGGNPFQRSDLNFDGAIDSDDYGIFLMHNLTDIDPDMTLDDVGSYVFGDLDGDQDNDVQDFRLFKADYIAANGMAAFAALAAVPEPASVCLLVLGSGLALQMRRRNQR